MPPDLLTERTDEELAAAGSVEELYRRYSRRLIGFLANQGVGPGDREDVHHEVWLRVWKHLHGDYQNQHFRGWLFTIARNLAGDWRRRKRPSALDPKIDVAAEAAEDQLEQDEHRIRFRRCLDKLAPVEADLVRGRIDGEDYESLATKLGMTIKQAYKSFFDVKRQLQDCVERN
ncbi:MAG: RNA polymerase sigma factor [Gemmataceae bacterium]